MRLLFLLFPSLLLAQVTEADYQRALGLRAMLRSLAAGLPEAPHSIAGMHCFWYRISVAGGNEFVLLNADTRQKKPAFDHKKLAASFPPRAGLLTRPLRCPSIWSRLPITKLH